MKIRWTERKDNKGPLFGTFINDQKTEDNFPIIEALGGFKKIGRITCVKGDKIKNVISAATR